MGEPDDSMSDGCSSPLGLWMERAWPSALAICFEHDVAYEKGGDARDRLIADLKFFVGLLEHGIPPEICQQAYNAVRIFGALYWNGEDDGSIVCVPGPEIPQTA
jgi:hypothetical protein